MKCPACNATLVVLEHELVEVDHCLSCRGVWLDAGEIELLFGDNDACTAFFNAGKPVETHEKRRNCPRCGRRMTKESTAGDAPIVYDRCSRGHGLWLDCGELCGVLAHGKEFARGSDVARFLRDVFPQEAPADLPRQDK